MLALMLTSKGVAGVPRAALIVLAGTLASFNIPIVGVAILLGIDQILDMGRTTVNLIGNCVATVVIARWENCFDYNKMNEFLKQRRMRINTLGKTNNDVSFEKAQQIIEQTQEFIDYQRKGIVGKKRWHA